MAAESVESIVYYPTKTETGTHISPEVEKSATLSERIYANGLKSYIVGIDQEVVQDCNIADQEWNEGFFKYISDKYPYTMSPETTEKIIGISKSFKIRLADKGFNIAKWDVNGDSEHGIYVNSVLKRVLVPDTVEPIIDNTDKMANYLRTLSEEEPERILNIRSFFTGAGVAEKSLIARLSQMNIEKFNLITTDNSADSIAIAALNIALWNENLPEKDKFEIHIVKGRIPQELYGKERTIVLQVEDAQKAAEYEKDNANIHFDSLLLDNGLPYFGKDFGLDLLDKMLKVSGNRGLYIGILGLDSKIKVEIPVTTKIKRILQSLTGNLQEELMAKKQYDAPYNYPHVYKYSVSDNGDILINDVLSSGSVRVYNWLGDLFKTNLKKFGEVMSAIKSATSLSRAKDSVVTSPEETHKSFTDYLRENNCEYEEVEKPLDPHTFGWESIGEDKYANNKDGNVKNWDEVMEICKRQDPLVLIKTVLRVLPRKQ